MVEIINSFYRTFSYALLSTAGVARRLMACSLLLFSAVYSHQVKRAPAVQGKIP